MERKQQKHFLGITVDEKMKDRIEDLARTRNLSRARVLRMFIQTGISVEAGVSELLDEAIVGFEFTYPLLVINLVEQGLLLEKIAQDPETRLVLENLGEEDEVVDREIITLVSLVSVLTE